MPNRLIALTNRSLRSRRFQLTSFADFVLARITPMSRTPPSEIFTETATLPEKQARVAASRARREADLVGQVLADDGARLVRVRNGPGSSARAHPKNPPPVAPLVRRTGSVDPIFSLRADVRRPGYRRGSPSPSGRTREQVEKLVEKYHDLNSGRARWKWRGPGPSFSSAIWDSGRRGTAVHGAGVANMLYPND
jgi:hypothetical protein